MCNFKCCGPLFVVGKVLLLIGGLNWGLVGVGMLFGSNWNIVNLLLDSWPVLEAIVYVLVGLSALGGICRCKCGKCKDTCAPASASMGQ
jgi:uncharacterized membrane protein YuzA (DUF378 family)